MSTEVRFWLPTEYRIFWKTYEIPRNFAVFFAVKFAGIQRNSVCICMYVFPDSKFQKYSNKYLSSTGTLIKKKIEFSLNIRKFWVEQLQSHIWLTASPYMGKYLRISSYIIGSPSSYMTLQLLHSNFLLKYSVGSRWEHSSPRQVTYSWFLAGNCQLTQQWETKKVNLVRGRWTIGPLNMTKTTRRER